MPSANLQQIVEYRGVEGLVAARILTDDDTNGYTTGSVFAIAGVAEVSKSTDSSSETKYYDNMPAIVIMSNGADEVTINVSAIPLDVLAEITGQNYDSDTGALVEGAREPRYFALGYKTKKTNGDEMYVWRYKGTFAVPDETNATENDGTDSNGQELTYTGISTTHKFTKYNKGAKAMVVDTSKHLADVSNFFSTVTTPDTLVQATKYKLTKTQAANTTLSVKRRGEELANNADIYAGDELLITVTGGTVAVNSSSFISGDIHVVTGNTTVASTASA